MTKFKEDPLTRNAMESFIKVLDEHSKSRFEKITKNDLRFGEDKKRHDIELDDFVVPKKNIERNDFASMNYKLYDIPGNSPIANKVNQMIWPTSMKWVSVPSVVTPSCYDKLKTQPPNGSKILNADRATSKMLASRFLATNIISTGAALMRSSGSTWMTHAPKSAFKSFPNYRHFVFDTSIMKFEENVVEKILNDDKDLCEIIESATKIAVNNHRRLKENLNYSGIDNQDKIRKKEYRYREINEINRGDVADGNNLKRNDAEEHVLPKNRNVEELDKSIVEYYSSGHESFICQKATSSNLGSIEKQVEELIRYPKKHCKRICKRDETRMKTKEATGHSSILPDASLNCHVDEMKVMGNTDHTDSEFEKFKNKTKEEYKLNNNGEEKMVVPCPYDGPFKSTDSQLMEFAKDDMDISDLKKITLHFDKKDFSMKENSLNISVISYPGSNGSLCNNDVCNVIENATDSADEVDSSLNVIYNENDQTVNKDTGDTLRRSFELDTHIGRTEENSHGNNSENNNLDNDLDFTHSEDERASGTTDVKPNATLAQLDESPVFGEDSLFGVLGVYCSSELQS